MLKILFTHSFGLEFGNHVCQTKKLKTVHTLQCTLYTVYYLPYRQDFSTLETCQEKLIALLLLMTTTKMPNRHLNLVKFRLVENGPLINP